MGHGAVSLGGPPGIQKSCAGLKLQQLFYLGCTHVVFVSADGMKSAANETAAATEADRYGITLLSLRLTTINGEGLAPTETPENTRNILRLCSALNLQASGSRAYVCSNAVGGMALALCVTAAICRTAPRSLSDCVDLARRVVPERLSAAHLASIVASVGFLARATAAVPAPAAQGRSVQQLSEMASVVAAVAQNKGIFILLV